MIFTQLEEEIIEEASFNWVGTYLKTNDGKIVQYTVILRYTGYVMLCTVWYAALCYAHSGVSCFTWVLHAVVCRAVV